MRRGRRGRRQRRRGTWRDEGGAGADVLHGERERGARQRERCGWGARTLVEREIGKGKGGKKKQKKRKHEKNRKKRKKREKTILFNLKVQQQLFNYYLTISSSILYICNRMSKFYKSQKMSNLPAYIRLYKC